MNQTINNTNPEYQNQMKLIFELFEANTKHSIDQAVEKFRTLKSISENICRSEVIKEIKSSYILFKDLQILL